MSSAYLPALPKGMSKPALCHKHQSSHMTTTLQKPQLRRKNTFTYIYHPPKQSCFASTSTPIASSPSSSCRSILLKCSHINFSPLLSMEMCFLLLLCGTELETSSWAPNASDTSRNVSSVYSQSRCSTEHGRMPCPLTGVPFSAAPHWLAVRSSLPTWVGIKMQLIFWMGCPLQVLHGVVSFVQVLVVDNALAYWWRWSEECCGHQAMHKNCLPGWVWANLSDVVPCISKAPLWYHASAWCYSSEGTHHPSWNLETCRIKHRLPLFTERSFSNHMRLIYKSEFDSFGGRSVVAMFWHRVPVHPDFLRSWTHWRGSLPFIYPLYPPLHWFALTMTGFSSLQVCIRMRYVLTTARILQVVQVIIGFVSISVIHLPGVHIAGQTTKCYHDDTMDWPTLSTQANCSIPLWSETSSHHNTFWIANSSKRTYLPPTARLKSLVRQISKGCRYPCPYFKANLTCRKQWRHMKMTQHCRSASNKFPGLNLCRSSINVIIQPERWKLERPVCTATSKRIDEDCGGVPVVSGTISCLQVVCHVSLAVTNRTSLSTKCSKAFWKL